VRLTWRRRSPQPPPPIACTPHPVPDGEARDIVTASDFAARLLLSHVEPTDRALTGWQGWRTGPGDPP